MVELMDSMKRSAVVKLELEEPLDHHKRSKLYSSSHQYSLDSTAESISPPPLESAYSTPLDEPSPLGLRLKKSPSFLDLIQMRLSQEYASKKKGGGCSSGANSSGGIEKLKASNFPASTLRIGTWEYKSRYEGDLVAKCYFAKHKLVWEVLDGGLKNKIEIQWSDIMAIKAKYSDDGPDTLDVALARRPLFFRETNPQPRKHTLWQATSDFTGEQASLHRRHFLQSPKGFLSKHFEKLIQCDPRLCYLSQQPDIIIESPYFEMTIPAFADQNESRLGYPTSSSGYQTSRRKEYGNEGRSSEHHSQGCTSGSAIDNHTIEDISSYGNGNTKFLSSLEHIRVPGLHQSMSVSDLVSHIGHHIAEQITSTNPALSGQRGRPTIEDITQFLLGDSEFMSASNEQVLLSRINSLCCLLQKEPETIKNIQSRGSASNSIGLFKDEKFSEDKFNSASPGCMAEFSPAPRDQSANTAELKQAIGEQTNPGMLRKDSVGELLVNLPRVASLPQFFHIFTDDFSNQAR